MPLDREMRRLLFLLTFVSINLVAMKVCIDIDALTDLQPCTASSPHPGPA